MDLSRILLYRILHFDNLEFILEKGKITHSNHRDADARYVGIGEDDLIRLRKSQKITTVNSNKNYCPSNDYISFYFHYRSVMLYRIQTGHKVQKRDASEIIYLVFKLDEILPDIEYLFTDGHGYARFTRWFDDISLINELD